MYKIRPEDTKKIFIGRQNFDRRVKISRNPNSKKEQQGTTHLFSVTSSFLVFLPPAMLKIFLSCCMNFF